MAHLRKLTLALFLVFSCGSFTSYETERKLVITFVDVGQGDAALVQTPDNHNILIDCGQSACGIDNILQDRAVTNIDLLILTHSHSDHTGGLPELANTTAIRRMYFPRGMVPSFIPQMCETISVLAGDTLFTADSVSIVIKWPQKRVPRSGDSANEYSIAAKLMWHNSAIFFAGDIGFPEEKQLIDDVRLSTCNILKIGHHGSGNSSSWEFLQAINPFLSIISVGTNNSYGLPESGALYRIKNMSREVLRTDVNGTISVNFSQNGEMSVMSR
jgi:competence protein ComEC